MSHLKKALQLGTVILFICSLLYCGKGSVKSTHDTQPDHFKSAVEMVSAIRVTEINNSTYDQHFNSKGYLQPIFRYQAFFQSFFLFGSLLCLLI